MSDGGAAWGGRFAGPGGFFRGGFLFLEVELFLEAVLDHFIHRFDGNEFDFPADVFRNFGHVFFVVLRDDDGFDLHAVRRQRFLL